MNGVIMCWYDQNNRDSYFDVPLISEFNSPDYFRFEKWNPPNIWEKMINLEIAREAREFFWEFFTPKNSIFNEIWAYLSKIFGNPP